MHEMCLIDSPNTLMSYISLTRIDTSFKTSPHAHKALEIIFIFDGCGFIHHKEGKLPIKKGDIIIINANSIHYETALNLSFYALGFNNRSIRELTKSDNSIIFAESKNEYERILANCSAMMMEVESKDTGWEEITNNYASNIIGSIKRLLNIKITELRASYTYVVSEIKKIIDDFYNAEINLENISNKLGMSISRICHVFKEETGQSIIDYRIDKQLQEAKSLLITSDMPINQISSLVGFSDSSYFAKTFKRKYKITPKQMREKEK